LLIVGEGEEVDNTGEKNPRGRRGDTPHKENMQVRKKQVLLLGEKKTTKGIKEMGETDTLNGARRCSRKKEKKRLLRGKMIRIKR